VALATVALTWWAASRVQARIVETVTFQQLLDGSDLVAIAEPLASTKDTGEESILPNIAPVTTCVGVATTFRVSALLKGDRTFRGSSCATAAWIVLRRAQS
jgi:hypothetical protein